LATKEKLDDELNYLFKVSESISNPFNQALYIHNNLAYLQYFTDCNKRTQCGAKTTSKDDIYT